VEEYFKSPATTSADGASVYRTAPSSPYEMVMVWYSGDRVSRLVAVQRDRPGSMPREVTEALNQTWGKNFEEFGYIARMEGANGHVLGAYAWHDDRVRIRTSVQTTDQGPRIMTEWRYFPVVVDPTKKQD
jgi:hypothetical protein